MIKTCAVVFALACASGGAPASASLFCGVRTTADGFVALRAKPDAQSRLVARMHAGDEVSPDGGEAMRNGWEKVTWWQGGRFKFVHARGNDPPNGRGWVKGRLVAEECG